jgi:Calcineurin-like phosphoesterase
LALGIILPNIYNPFIIVPKQANAGNPNDLNSSNKPDDKPPPLPRTILLDPLVLTKVKETVNNRNNSDNNKQYSSFNYLNAHVLTMATELSFGKGSAQYNFVDNDLKSAATNPNIKWIIVNYHTPMYTSPNTCSASSCNGSSPHRDVYHPLFDKYGVDLVLQGHVHNYQRTYPLKYDPVSPSSPTITSTSTSSYTDPQGEIFATVGTGGINFHGFSDRSYFVAYQQAQKFGMLDILMANDGSKLTGKYYANGASSPSDQFTISKPTAISSVAISRANGVNTNLTGNDSQVAEDRESVVGRDHNIVKLPDLSEIINNTKRAEKTPARVLNITNNEDSSPDNRPITPRGQ